MKERIKEQLDGMIRENIIAGLIEDIKFDNINQIIEAHQYLRDEINDPMLPHRIAIAQGIKEN